ncbi:MAG: DNA polymerase III subunit delta' [Notoacmeibacter sp.]|nr:DNA polymerase III subunit delta' [Notoacmeibacter sp.]MCC0033153.1 DNA polymerase III subunit delta' [Brucellaceae bacterium]
MMEKLSPEQADSLPGIPDPAENPNLFGHGEQADQLAEAFRSGRMHHALLFTGPSGIGKATLAFHLAWHLLKERDPATAAAHLAAPEPGSAVWRQMAAGSHPGVLHLARPYDDKAKKFRQVITVDEIRRVGRFLSRTAHDGGYRIVIIDSADDMNTNAANALLKSLEEPPRATLFILISHSPGRLLPTIRSRCQVHRFSPLGSDVLEQVLASIGADMPMDDAGRQRLLELSEGSARNALLMTQYGGLDIAQACDSVLDARGFDVGAAGKIANAVAARGADIPFDLFNRHLTDRLARDAASAASGGDPGRARRLETLWRETGETILQAVTYNLDKRQHVMGLLNRLNAELAR